MSPWLLLVGLSAAGGALIVWHAAGRQKQMSELLLDQYAGLLATARSQRMQELRDRSLVEVDPGEIEEATVAEIEGGP
jgi:hypothetical protein